MATEGEPIGWTLDRHGAGQECWVKELSTESVASVYCWPDGDVTWTVDDRAGRSLRGGKLTDRAAAMRACEAH